MQDPRGWDPLALPPGGIGVRVAMGRQRDVASPVDKPDAPCAKPGVSTPICRTLTNAESWGRTAEGWRRRGGVRASAHAPAAPDFEVRTKPVVPLALRSEGVRRVRPLVGGAWARQGRGLSSRAAPPLGLREAATASPCLFPVVGDCFTSVLGDYGGPQQAGHPSHLQAPAFGAH